MLDSTLFEDFLRLGDAERREFVRAAQATIDDEDVPPAIRAEIERRLADMGPEPASEFITTDDFRNQIAERRAQRSA